MSCIDKREYSLIDVDGLSTCLAETDWKNETENITTEDLYDTVVDQTGCVKSVPKPHWASAFFALKESYLHLIAHFRKEDNEDATESQGGSNQ